MALLIGVFALPSPDSVAVEEEPRSPGWSVIEADGAEPCIDDVPPGLGDTAIDAAVEFRTHHLAPARRNTSAAPHPALVARDTRAPPA